MELPTGLMPMEEIVIPDTDEIEVYTAGANDLSAVYSSKASAVYSSEWEKYSNYYFYNQLSDAEREYWDALNAICIPYTTAAATAEKYTGSEGKISYHTAFARSTTLTFEEMEKVFSFLDSPIHNIIF